MPLVDVALSRVAEELGAEFVEEKGGERIYRCFRGIFNLGGHNNGDQNPSLRINDGTGKFNCTCEMQGESAASLVMGRFPEMDTKAAGKWLHEHFGENAMPEEHIITEKRRATSTKKTHKKKTNPLPSKPLSKEEWVAAQSALLPDKEARAIWEGRGIRLAWLQRAGAGIGQMGGEKTTAVKMWKFDGEPTAWRICGVMHRRITRNTDSGWWFKKKVVDEEVVWEPQKSLANDGGEMGLYVPPDGLKKGEPVYVFEGGPDWFCAIGFRLNAIGVPVAINKKHEPEKSVLAPSLVELLKDHEQIILCPQRDPAGQSQLGMKNVAAIVGRIRCRVLWPPKDTGKDFADAIRAGVDPFAGVTLTGLDTLGVLDPVLGLNQLSERVPQVDENAGAMTVTLRNGMPARVANFDLRVTSEMIREGINAWDPPTSEVEVEVIPLSGAMKGKKIRVGALSPATWLDQRLTLQRIMDVYPSAQVGDVWPQAWASVRGRAQTLCPDTMRGRRVCSRSGWHGDRYVMPSLSLGPDGEIVASGETEARWILNHDLRPPLDGREQILDLAEAVLTLSRMGNDEHVNAVMMGIHMAAALQSRLDRQMIACPNLFLESMSTSGKSWLARAHMLPWVPGTVIGDKATPGELGLGSSTPKAAREALSALWDTIVLIDNWNPMAMTRDREEWIRLFHTIFDKSTTRRLTSTLQTRDTSPTGACIIVTGEQLPQDFGAETRFVSVRFNVSPWNDDVLSDAVRKKAALDGEMKCRKVQRSAETLLSLIPTCLRHGRRMYGSFTALENHAGELADTWGARLSESASGRGTRLLTSVAIGLQLLGDILADAVRSVAPDAIELFEVQSRFNGLQESLAAWYAQGQTNGRKVNEWRPDEQFLREIDSLVVQNQIGCANFNEKRPAVMRWDAADPTYRPDGGGTVSIEWNSCWSEVSKALQRTGRPIKASVASVKQLLQQRGWLLHTDIVRHMPLESRRLKMVILHEDAFEFLKGEKTQTGVGQEEMDL